MEMKQSLRGEQWRILITMSVLMVFVYVDYYGISIALPVIGRDFGANTAALGWIMNAYLLAFAAPIIAVGRLADIVGRRLIAILGTVLFIVGAVLSGLSTDLILIIIARAMQGLGAAMISVASLSIVSIAFDAEQRGYGIGLWSAIAAAGGAVGPFICGMITHTLSWRWFFFLEAAIAAIGLVLIVFFTKESRDKNAPRKVDILGFAVLTAGLVLLVAGLELAELFGWKSPWVYTCFIGGAAFLGIFYKVERTVDAPLVDFSLLGNRNFLGACLVEALTFLPYGALMLFLALYLQFVMGYSPLATGAIFLMLMGPFMIVTFFGGKMMELLGTREALAISMGIIAVSFACFGFVHPDTGLVFVLLGLLLFGIGQGLNYDVATAAVMNSAPDEKSGAASGIMMSARTIALAIGVAAAGSFFRASEESRLRDLFELAGNSLDPTAHADIHGLLSGSRAAREKIHSIAPTVGDRIDLIVDESFLAAFRNVMFLSIILTVVGVFMTFLIRRMQVSAEAPPHEGGSRA